MNRFSLRALFISFILTLCLPASASVITINSWLDLTTAEDNPNPITSTVAVTNYSAPTIMISAGDTVRLVYDFLPGQSMRMTGGYWGQAFWVETWMDHDWSNPEPGTAAFSNISVAFQGLTGNLAKPIFKASDSAPGFIIGALGLQDNYIADGETISFTGVTATFTVDSFTDGPRYYNMPSVWFISWDGYVSPEFVAVPEPAGMALFMIGLVIVTGMARRRRAV